MTPLGAVVRGLLAGAIGTAVFDAFLFARYRRGGGDSRFADWDERRARGREFINGAQYGIVAGSMPKQRIGYGLPFGATVWGSGDMILPATKLYEPTWKYDAKTLTNDLSAHLVYGLGTAAAFGLLSRKEPACR